MMPSSHFVRRGSVTVQMGHASWGAIIMDAQANGVVAVTGDDIGSLPAVEIGLNHLVPSLSSGDMVSIRDIVREAQRAAVADEKSNLILIARVADCYSARAHVHLGYADNNDGFAGFCQEILGIGERKARYLRSVARYLTTVDQRQAREILTLPWSKAKELVGVPAGELPKVIETAKTSSTIVTREAAAVAKGRDPMPRRRPWSIQMEDDRIAVISSVLEEAKQYIRHEGGMEADADVDSGHALEIICAEWMAASGRPWEPEDLTRYVKTRWGIDIDLTGANDDATAAMAPPVLIPEDQDAGTSPTANDNSIEGSANPYLVPRPALISFSGGRTSGYLLKQIIDAHGGTLPDDVQVVFCNTGKEREETLEFVHRCEREWGIPITWLEYDPASASNTRVVSFETASRNGEPFSALLERRMMPPNPVSRFCTIEMKIRRIQAHARQTLGWDRWHSVVGLRADEPKRVQKQRERAAKRGPGEGVPVMPLASAGVTKEKVVDWWQEQPFDLELPSVDGKTPQGNCEFCFLKGKKALVELAKTNPDGMEWWLAMERRFPSTKRPGEFCTFRSDRTYQQVLDLAFPGARVTEACSMEASAPVCAVQGDDDDLGDCNCTD